MHLLLINPWTPPPEPYGALNLRVWANADGSFKLTWLAGAVLAETVWDEEETRWQNGRTSTR